MNSLVATRGWSRNVRQVKRGHQRRRSVEVMLSLIINVAVHDDIEQLSVVKRIEAYTVDEISST
jgi:hypothetical protein